MLHPARPLPVLLLTGATLFATYAPATAQQLRLDEPWRWTVLGTDWGLPSNSASDVVETDDGTAWASTTGGLAYFDGFRWRAIGPDRGLPAGLISDLSAQGNSVLVVVESALYQGGRSGFERVSVRSSQGENVRVTSVAPAGPGRIVVYSPGHGLVYVGPEPPIPEPPGEMRLHHPSLLVAESAGTLFANSWSGLHRLPAGSDVWETVVRAPGTRPVAVLAVRESSSGRGAALVDDEDAVRGVWSWAPGRAPTLTPVTGALSSLLDVAPDGTVYAAVPALSALAPGASTWTSVPGAPVPADWNFMRHASGRVWLQGQARLALYHGESRAWDRWIPPGDPRSAAHVNDIAAGPDGSILMATEDGLKMRSPDGTWPAIDSEPGAPRGVLTAVATARDGAVWVGSGGDFAGAFVWDGARWSGPDAALFDGLHIHRFVAGLDGDLWALAFEPGASVSDTSARAAFVIRNGRPTRWEPLTDSGLGRVYAMDHGEDGTPWFAGVGGLARFRAGRWTRWDLAEGLRSRQVFHVVAGADGSAWFVDRLNGVGRVEADGAVRYWTIRDGLPSDQTWQLARDAAGNIWVTTQAGAAVYDGEGWTSYDHSTGLSDDRLWPIHVEGRRVYFGSFGGGVSVFSPDEADATPPLIELEEPIVATGGVSVSWAAFPHGASVPLERVQSRFSVDGGTWSPWSFRTGTFLSSPMPGSHNFAVEARVPMATPLPSAASVSYSVPLPLFRRPEVILFGGLGMLGFGSILFFGGLRLRNQGTTLQRAEALYAGFFQHALTGNFIVDADGKVQACNQAFADTFGFASPRDVSGLDVRSLFLTESSAQEVLDLVEREGGVVGLELDMRTRAGARCRAQLSLRRPTTGGANPGLWGYVVDVTESRGLERQLLASQKMEAVGRLAGGVAHDFNNLLTAIYGFTELSVLDIEVDHPAQENLGQVLNAARRAQDLTAQLLDFGRKSILEIERTDVNRVVREVEPILRSTLREDIELEMSYGAGLDDVLVDPGRLTQVVLNLIVNARDALPRAGHIVVMTRIADDSEVKESIARTGPRRRFICIEVRDDGEGIPAEVLPRIFEPFFTTKEPGRGTGLGLSTVYAIADRFGGGVLVDSTEGVGTRVRVLIPIVDERPGVESATPRVRPVPGTGRILVVEDDPSVRQLLVRTLETAGHDVVPHENGFAAIDWLDTSGATFDLMVCDLVMPGMGGSELADRLEARLGSFPILFTSGYPADQVAAFSGRVIEDLLQKPFTPEELLRHVGSLLPQV